VEVPGHEVTAVVVAQCQAASGAGVEMAELVADHHADGLSSLQAGFAFGDVPAEQFGMCSMTPNSQTLPSWTVAIWVASVAHIRFGAVVMICRSCGVSARVWARCGESRACSRISRSTHLRATWIPSITRRRAQTLRWPSPVQGRACEICADRRQ